VCLECICSEDIELSKLSGLPPEVHQFQRIYNPLHLYCRLMELGIYDKKAKQIVFKYEQEVYKVAEAYIKERYGHKKQA